ncbi:hypothetical protein [Gulosibacter molinativorax]|uniref:Uncharacterized protein n=1 Tax=Gulosibacter molinativorax TaxID=256821 RepID=A0ABT7CBS5_9MICO|nr:hypothetical protein [Gulosibacter molinativorax]MDJ1372652.1 hypothetical protein [Gulosibacter molinativorax]QUY62386.1 Hypotetical protein [Gulosibacter molinativorax]
MALTDIQSDDLLAEISLLRKNEGFVARRVQPRSILLAVLDGGGDSFERLRHRFISAIHTLDDDEAALLLDVFALSPETEGVARLLERRKIHGTKIDRGTETVASRELPALEHLLSRLVTGRYAQSPYTLEVPDMHNGIIYEQTSTLIVIENRKWKETREHYRFVATFEEMDYLTISRSYPAEAIPYPGGAFKINTRAVEGAGWNDHFWHLNAERTEVEPMRRGEGYDIRFSLRPTDVVEPRSHRLAARAFHQRSLLASIQVGFIGDRPKSIWKFDQVSPFAIPESGNEYTAVEMDERGVASLRMRDVHGGLFSGLAWSW